MDTDYTVWYPRRPQCKLSLFLMMMTMSYNKSDCYFRQCASKYCVPKTWQLIMSTTIVIFTTLIKISKLPYMVLPVVIYSTPTFIHSERNTISSIYTNVSFISTTLLIVLSWFWILFLLTNLINAHKTCISKIKSATSFSYHWLCSCYMCQNIHICSRGQKRFWYPYSIT